MFFVCQNLIMAHQMAPYYKAQVMLNQNVAYNYFNFYLNSKIIALAANILCWDLYIFIRSFWIGALNKIF